MQAMIALPASFSSAPRKENSLSCERDDKKTTPVIPRALHLLYNRERGCYRKVSRVCFRQRQIQ